MRRVTVQAPNESAKDVEPSPSRRSSISSSNWENARYKRRSGSYTSLNSTVQQTGPIVGYPTPLRPPTTRTQTAPPPIVRQIYKSRTPSSQQMAYHFRNGSTGHLNTNTYHYRDRHSQYHQPHYRKVASASHSSVIRTSMYGQYGWYGDTSRKNSVISLELPPPPDGYYGHAPERRSSRQSVYGHTTPSQSQQSLESSATRANERHRSRQSVYGHPDVSMSQQSFDIPDQSRYGGSAYDINDHSRRQSVDNSHSHVSPVPRPAPSREPSQSRPTSSMSNRSARPLPPEPPTLPPPDLNPGWPPRGWHVYVSAMTQDYLYGGPGSSQRPVLDDYVFDQDTLTFVKPPQLNGEGSGGLQAQEGAHGSGEAIPQAYAYEPSPGPGPRGRGTQSLDIPRNSAAYESFSHPRPREPKKSPSVLKKAPTRSKSKGAPKPKAPVITPSASDTQASIATPDMPNTPTTDPANGSRIFSFLKSPSSVSVTSRKSTKSKNGSGWFKKRSKSVSGPYIEGNDHEVPPPLPALPGLNLPGTNLRLEPWGIQPDKANRANGKVGDGGFGMGEEALKLNKEESPALCDASIKLDWKVQAREDDEEGSEKQRPRSKLVSNEVFNAMDSNSSDRDSGSGSQDAATESDPSIAPGSQGQSQDRSNHRRSSASAISSSQKQRIKDTFKSEDAPQRESSPSPPPYPSPPSSATGHQRRSASIRTSSVPSNASSTSLSATPSRTSIVTRRNSTRIGKNGAYILDTLDSSMISSPYPPAYPIHEPQSAVIQRAPPRNSSSATRPSRPESSMSMASTTTVSQPPAPRQPSRAASATVYSRPDSSMSMMSMVSDATAIASPRPMSPATPARGSSLDMYSQNRSYSPYPPNPNYTSAPQSPYSTPPQSVQSHSPMTSSSPTKALSTSPVATPTKLKGWKRWTSPLSGSPKREKGISNLSVEAFVLPPQSVRSGTALGSSSAIGSANGGGTEYSGAGTGSLIWSAPSVSVQAAPSKLRKKRK